MVYENQKREETIDLMVLIANILRKWQWLLLSILLGVLLLGAYKGILRPSKTEDTSKIKTAQTALDSNISKLETNQAEITSNTDKIAVYQKKIETNEELLTTRHASQAVLEDSLATLQAALSETQTLLTNSSTGSDWSTLTMQLLTLTNDITDTNQQINSIAEKIRTTKNEITSWRQEIKTLTASNQALTDTNTDLQAQISSQTATLEKLSGNAGGRSLIIYLIIGAMLGAFIFLGIILLQYILYKKIRSSDELKDQYSLPILGEFTSTQTQSHGKFGKWLDKLVGDIQTLPEKQQVYELIAAGIQAPALPLPVQLAVTGTVDTSLLQEVCKQLHGLLPTGYTIIKADNPVYNAKFLSNIKQYTILLVEAKMISDKHEVNKLIETLYRNKVDVIGTVVL